MRLAWLVVGVWLGLTACADGGRGDRRGGGRDTGIIRVDAGPGLDTGPGFDAGRPSDAGRPTDAGRLPDTGPPDAGRPPDTGPTCATLRCTMPATCMMEGTLARCVCPPGYSDPTGTGAPCVDVDECTMGLDDCHADATCTNTPGMFTCMCRPGFTGDGRTCTRFTGTGRILVYYDSGDTVADEAITALGLTPVMTTDGGTFNTMYDSGTYDIVILDVPGSALPSGMWTRLSARIAAGGALIFNWWQLDSDVSVQTGLGVSTLSYNTWRQVYRDPGSPVDLFGLRESVPSPITGSDMAGDDGDELTLRGAGFIAARLDSASGPGAIAVTNGNRTIVNGFLPWDCRTGDTDADGRIDMVELYMNEITYLMR